jgi:hypothetical protein
MDQLELRNRDIAIRKLRKDGNTRKYVAILFKLSPSRISQICGILRCKKPLLNMIKISWNGKVKRLLRRY